MRYLDIRSECAKYLESLWSKCLITVWVQCGFPSFICWHVVTSRNTRICIGRWRGNNNLIICHIIIIAWNLSCFINVEYFRVKTFERYLHLGCFMYFQLFEMTAKKEKKNKLIFLMLNFYLSCWRPDVSCVFETKAVWGALRKVSWGESLKENDHIGIKYFCCRYTHILCSYSSSRIVVNVRCPTFLTSAYNVSKLNYWRCQGFPNFLRCAPLWFIW